MIQFANDSLKQQVWDMWKTVFGDTNDYMEIYFRDKYSNENTLLYMIDEKAVASLQMLNYNISFYGEEVPIIYLSGLVTLPEHRGQGYMKQLIYRCFEVAAKREIPLLILVPQENWLFDFYDKYGFAKTFDSGANDLPSLKTMIDNHKGDLKSAYKEFNSLFRNQDMTVQKTFDDFKTLMEVEALFDFPTKRNLNGMTRIIDADKLLNIFASKHPQYSIDLDVNDELITYNNTVHTVNNGESHNIKETSTDPLVTYRVDIRELSQLLFGYHTSKKEDPFNTMFVENTPQMHFMLE